MTQNIISQSSPFMFEASDKTDLNIANSCMGTDKFIVHQYLDTYERFVAPLKEKAQNVLEIGICSGYSILMWHDFFTQAHIYGIDVSAAPSFLQKDRITTYRQNAYDTSFIEKEFISKNIKFDLIIDDGPHTLESWQFFANHYLNLLNVGGIAIIEDIPQMAHATAILPSISKSFKGKIYIGSFYSYNNTYDEQVIIFHP